MTGFILTAFYTFIAGSAAVVAFCESGVTVWATLAGALWLIGMAELIRRTG